MMKTETILLNGDPTRRWPARTCCRGCSTDVLWHATLALVEHLADDPAVLPSARLDDHRLWRDEDIAQLDLGRSDAGLNAAPVNKS